MLVLSRRPQEKIIFPGIQTTVQVVAVKPGVVRLGIDAPPEVAVFRDEVLTRQAPDGVAARRPTKDRRTLLVEDNPNERELLAGLFRLAGFQVHAADAGGAALELLRTRGQPDLMLIHLPRAAHAEDDPGLTAVQCIRRDPGLARLRIYGMAQKLPAAGPAAGRVLGVDRWYRKPLNPEKLLQDLRAELALEEVAA